MKWIAVLLLFAAVTISFLIAGCGSSSGSNEGSDISFVGSCTGAPGNFMDGTCTDYYNGYTVQDGQAECAHQNDIYSSDPCASVNEGWTKIPGQCQVTDPPADNNRLSSISFYEPDYDLNRAQSLCNAINSVQDYTGTWIAD